MIVIYHPQNPIEGQCLLDFLQSRKIRAHLSGVDLMGAVGELPAIGLLGLSVPNEDAAIARQLVEEYLSASPILNQDDG